jgi:transcriptional regulator with XRE-family HTH domain
MKHEPILLPTVREILASEGRSRWQEIADKTGIPLSTIKKIRYGEVSDPSVNTVERLYFYLTRDSAA